MIAHVCDGSRASCLGCAAIAKRRAELRAAMTLDEQLDDLTRARIWTRVSTRLARPQPIQWRRPIAACAFAAAAVVVTIVAVRHRESRSEPLASALTLTAPAQSTLATRLGPHTRAELVGPARLSIIGEPGDRTAVRLDAGALYAQFDGGPHRSLHIVAPGLAVDVVGTVFAVEVIDGHACVSVAHGRVRVTTPAMVRDVAANQRVCGDAAPQPIAPHVRDTLAHFDVQVAHHERPSEPAPVPVQAAQPERPIIAAPKRVPTVRHKEATPEAAVAAPAPAPAPVPAAQPSDDLYRNAEAALARHDLASADRALAQLLANAPNSPLVDQALYERANIAYQRRAWAEARRHLDKLAAIERTPLAEPGRYLACRVAVEAHDSDALQCLADYRNRYPQSPHDRDALGMSMQLAYADGGCRAVRPFLDELTTKYAESTLARAWRSRCSGAP